MMSVCERASGQVLCKKAFIIIDRIFYELSQFMFCRFLVDAVLTAFRSITELLEKFTSERARIDFQEKERKKETREN